ncbi:MAG TPA: HXXEE domain-containing protein [Anaerolineales bacterium]|nr:HXXEE domain-containing protein [Anaerolineales bacterium]
MKLTLAAKLGWFIGLIEIVSVSALLFLLRQPGLPARFGVILAFLLPITFGAHVFEEFTFPGKGSDWFRAYHAEYAQAFTDSYFFKINAIPLALSVLVTLGTFDFAGRFGFWGIRAWLAFLCMQAFNVGFHIRGAIKLKSKQPSPGMPSAILLYIPLTLISFYYLLKTGTVDIFSAAICIAIGSLLQPALDLIKKQGTKEKQLVP